MRLVPPSSPASSAGASPSTPAPGAASAVLPTGTLGENLGGSFARFPPQTPWLAANPLHQAFYLGDLEAIEAALPALRTLCAEKPKDFLALLTAALKRGQSEVFRVILEAKIVDIPPAQPESTYVSGSNQCNHGDGVLAFPFFRRYTPMRDGSSHFDGQRQRHLIHVYEEVDFLRVSPGVIAALLCQHGFLPHLPDDQNNWQPVELGHAKLESAFWHRVHGRHPLDGLHKLDLFEVDLAAIEDIHRLIVTRRMRLAAKGLPEIDNWRSRAADIERAYVLHLLFGGADKLEAMLRRQCPHETTHDIESLTLIEIMTVDFTSQTIKEDPSPRRWRRWGQFIAAHGMPAMARLHTSTALEVPEASVAATDAAYMRLKPDPLTTPAPPPKKPHRGVHRWRDHFAPHK